MSEIFSRKMRENEAIPRRKGKMSQPEGLKKPVSEP